MNREFDQILAGLPPRPPRSRLEPYAELIAELRRRGRPFREIAAVLAEKCHVNVAATTVMRFLAAESRKKTDETPPNGVPTLTTRSCEAANTSPVINPTTNEVRRRIEELKHRPAPVEPPPKLFHYDPDKPLTLMPKTEKK